MKVLMTTDAVGGIFSYCVQLAESLAPLGVDVVLATMGRPLSPAQRADAVRAGAEVVESEYQLEWMDEPWHDVERAGDWLLAVERDVRPDVVHVNGYAHAALPWRAPALLVAHSCVCSWWRAVLGEPAPSRYERYRTAVSRGLAAAECTVAPTAAMLRSLGQEYGPVRNGLIIHNGMRVPASAPARKEAFVLAAGRLWDPAKNIAELAQAAALLDWPVRVAGDRTGPDGREAPALDHVQTLGFLPREELARWMARAAIFAQPARYEPFGLSILEAAAARCALVLGDIPSLRELWQGAAEFVDPSDPVELGSTLAALVRDPARRMRLGRAARHRAERYGAARMAERYRDLYGSLTTIRKRPREPRPGVEMTQ
jgi:glycosyltransferase involved in cell wall biosynthesis